jgi:predicted RecB family nuclease
MVAPLSRSADSLSPQFFAISLLPGISEAEVAQLSTCGINTTLDLLRQTRSDEQRDELLVKLQLHSKYLAKWIAMADLARVPGVGCDYCGLLLHAGIRSMGQLAIASPHRIHPQLMRLNVTALNTREQCPTPSQVSAWVYRAELLFKPQPR